MRYDLVSAPCVVRQHSRPHASHLRPFSQQIIHFQQHPSRIMPILGAQLGNVGRKSGKKRHSSPSEWIAQYQGSIWEILPVAHDEVPSGRGAFITAISFLQRGRPSDSCMPPSVPDQPGQLQLQKSLNRAMACRGPGVMPGIHHGRSSARKR